MLVVAMEGRGGGSEGDRRWSNSCTKSVYKIQNEQGPLQLKITNMMSIAAPE